MKTNPLITDILRGPWLVNPAVVPEYEKLVNLFTTGQYRGTEIKRSEILAAASAPSSSTIVHRIKPRKTTNISYKKRDLSESLL